MRRITFSNKTAAVLIALGLSISVFAQQATPLASSENTQLGTAARVVSVSAIAGQDGVLIEWRTNYELNNVGFYLYREQAGSRVQVNSAIIPGSALIVGDGVPLREGYGYSFFDPAGTPDTKYSLESIDLHGKIMRHGDIPVSKTFGMKGQVFGPQGDAKASANGAPGSGQSTQSFQLSLPGSASDQIVSAGTISDQWPIAGQAALKIGVRQDGWYRLTQSQLVSAGLDPNTDARNLRLFVNGREIAIRVTRNSGPLTPSDFIEFYGSGVDFPWTDTQVYWLTGGAQSGKRISMLGNVGLDSTPLTPPAPPARVPSPAPATGGGFISLPGEWMMPRPEAVQSPAPNRQELKAPTEPNRAEIRSGEAFNQTEANTKEDPSVSPTVETKEAAANKHTESVAATAVKPAPTVAAGKASTVAARSLSPRRRKRHRRGRRVARRRSVKRNHADVVAAPAPSFQQTVANQVRVNYFGALQNGEAENFFGQVLTTPNSTIQQVLLKNIETTAEGPAQLEIALQGIGSAAQYSVFFNDVLVGTMDIFFRDHPVASFAIPIASLREGNNDVKFVPSGGSGISFVDYVRLTYPRSYRAENNSLRFTTRFNQTVRVDGFTSSGVRVLDISDPALITEVRPIVETTASGYALTIPAAGAPTKGRRTLLAFADGQFQQPASVTLNAPSNLNAASNSADLVIISHANFLPAVAPLAAQRVSQGLSVATVDVEDVYDEFGYGRHDPYALREFLSWAATTWATKPRYVIFMGDASSDPRNYQSIGNFDFVPTKIIDTLFLETASDDWLADFDDDGNAELAVGRLPARTPAEANTMVSKIVNFLPGNVPQSALMVADAQGSYYFNFEEANSTIASLLPPGMNVETVNRRTEPSDAAANANIIAKFNSGQAVVNYSGHGNTNAWAGSILTSADALALTNGNKLSFVVVMDCLNGYFVEPRAAGEGLAESFLKAPYGGAVAAFASSGETFPDGQHAMSQVLYALLYSGPPIPLGDAIKQAKVAPDVDLDVRRTWIFFGDPSMKIR